MLIIRFYGSNFFFFVPTEILDFCRTAFTVSIFVIFFMIIPSKHILCSSCAHQISTSSHFKIYSHFYHLPLVSNNSLYQRQCNKKLVKVTGLIKVGDIAIWLIDTPIRSARKLTFKQSWLTKIVLLQCAIKSAWKKCFFFSTISKRSCFNSPGMAQIVHYRCQTHKIHSHLNFLRTHSANVRIPRACTLCWCKKIK